DVATGRDLPDVIPHTQRSKVSWVGDGSAFYYTVHPTPGSVPKGDEHYYRKVRFHRLGDDPSRDAEVFGDGYPKETIVGVDAHARGRGVLARAPQGWHR